MVLAFLLIPAGLIALSLQSEPSVRSSDHVPADLTATRQAIRQNLHATPDNNPEKRIVLTANDLTAAANVAMQRKHLKGQTLCRIEENRIRCDISIAIHEHSPPMFLNLRTIAVSKKDSIVVEEAKIGRIHLPRPVLGAIMKFMANSSGLAPFVDMAEKMVTQMRIAGERLTISLKWNRQLLGELRGIHVGAADVERMLDYQMQLATILIQDETLGYYLRLGRLMRPIFQFAYERSKENHEPIQENRAAILVLSAYVSGTDLSNTLSADVHMPQRGILLNKRVDTAQHFMGAAAMAMTGQGTLVEMIGLAKELQDTHDGSGFSFNDLAADEAGALFGKLAIRTPEKAVHFQEILRQSIDEGQFIPILKDLPESMDSAEFVARFKSIGSPEYRAMEQEIHRRIMALPLYSNT